MQLTDDAETVTTPTEWGVFLVALVVALYLGVLGPWRVGGSAFGLPYLVAAATFFSALMLVIGIALEWSVRYSNVDLYRESSTERHRESSEEGARPESSPEEPQRG